MKLLKFSANWCQPCQELSRAIEKTTLPLEVVEIDVDQKADYAREFNVRGVPTLILVNNLGKEVSRKVGAMTTVVLKEWVNKNYDSE